MALTDFFSLLQIMWCGQRIRPEGAIDSAASQDVFPLSIQIFAMQSRGAA